MGKYVGDHVGVLDKIVTLQKKINLCGDECKAFLIILFFCIAFEKLNSKNSW